MASFTNAKFLAFSYYFAVCSYSMVTANWCTDYPYTRVCGCVESSKTYNNVIVCHYVSSDQKMFEVVQDILERKDDTDDIGFGLYTTTSLEYLPQDLFKGAPIDKITIGDVTLPRLGHPSESESPLNALSDTLKEIFMYRVGPLHDWEWEKVRLERVHEVRIEESTFSVVKKGFSDAFPNLETLILKYSNVMTIEPQAFAFPNKKLEYINMEGNHLRSLSRQMFRRKEWTEDERLDSILYLVFKENSIRTISDDFLLGMENLESVSLESNRIQHLSEDLFAPCAKSEWSCSLKHFNTFYNPLDNSTCQYLIDVYKKYPEAKHISPGIQCFIQLGLYDPENDLK